MNYETLIQEIKNAPMTWLPGIFHVVITQCVVKKVFNKGYMSDRIEDVEAIYGDDEEEEGEAT